LQHAAELAKYSQCPFFRSNGKLANGSLGAAGEINVYPKRGANGARCHGLIVTLGAEARVSSRQLEMQMSSGSKSEVDAGWRGLYWAQSQFHSRRARGYDSAS
jgi:hypothetical protein